MNNLDQGLLDNPEVLILIVYMTGAVLEYLMEVYLSRVSA